MTADVPLAAAVAARPLSDTDFRRVAETLHRHCGIYLTPVKKHLVAARLARVMRRAGHASYTHYLDRVLTDPAGEAFSGFVDALSTNITQFFREPVHFQYLRDTLVPAWRRQTRRVVRGWSAGCSTGEEAYSLAMTLLDALPAAAGWDVKILATDLSKRALGVATLGEYDADRLAFVPAAVRAKHVENRRRGGENILAVTDAVRERVAFRYLNLIDRWPFRGPMDFIFCRNVMIYFDKPTQQRVVERLYDCLRPGGVLMVGHSESLTGLRHRLRTMQPTIYHR